MPAKLAIRREDEAAVILQELGTGEAFPGERIVRVTKIIIKRHDAAMTQAAREESHHGFRRGIQVTVNVGEGDCLGSVLVECAYVQGVLVVAGHDAVVLRLDPGDAADLVKARQRSLERALDPCRVLVFRKGLGRQAAKRIESPHRAVITDATRFTMCQAERHTAITLKLRISALNRVETQGGKSASHEFATMSKLEMANIAGRLPPLAAGPMQRSLEGAWNAVPIDVY